MSDVTSPDNDNIRRQQERDLGHKLDHDDGRRTPPADRKSDKPAAPASDPKQR